MNIEFLARILHDMMLEIYKDDENTKKNLETYINMLKNKINGTPTF